MGANFISSEKVDCYRLMHRTLDRYEWDASMWVSTGTSGTYVQNILLVSQ